MNFEEAIKEIKYDNCNECESPLRFNTDCYGCHYKCAIEALEKQIPLKPFEVLGIYDNTEYECKYCGDEIPKKGKFYNHCPNCGQAIDWKE